MGGFFDEKRRFVLREFGRQPTFSSFLPGIAGPWGIPTWCNYNNRGQAVCSFGAEDKNHAISEFRAAVDAYRSTPFTGFRTFLKSDGRVVEPFADGLGTMTVEPNSLRLAWQSNAFSVEILYFTLPNAPLAGLCRRIRIINCTKSAISLELVDGLAAIVPYGIGDKKLKLEPNLSIAWMQARFGEKQLPIFRVSTTLEDTAAVSEIEGGNFCMAITGSGMKLPFLTKPTSIFGWDTSLRRPAALETAPLRELLAAPQAANEPPCAMAVWQGTLPANEPLELWEFYGQFRRTETRERFCREAATPIYFAEKYAQAQQLATQLTSKVLCKTADPIFDAYIEQNFLDNVMRGGFPYSFDNAGALPPVYLYSRKHGDPEREYNDFSVGSTYFSEGDGNFRDICQNRRSDAWFHPAAGAFNLRLFFELLQPDGYNPLAVNPVSYRVRHAERLCAALNAPARVEMMQLLRQPFSFGALAMRAEHLKVPNAKEFLSAVLADAQIEPNATAKEGYWSDHWTYLLDLIESYTAIFPEKEKMLLFDDATYRWFSGGFAVRGQSERYCIIGNGLRQYRCCDTVQRNAKWVLTADGKTAESTLAEKLLLLCAVKFATLDISGAAVEMEGGKPGWNDALNGLPGLLGSGVSEGCALLRLLEYLLDRQQLFPLHIEVFAEIAELLRADAALTNARLSKAEKWLRRNAVRENYRKAVSDGFSGIRTALAREELSTVLYTISADLRCAITAEAAENGGICPTYFYYRILQWQTEPQGILPKQAEKVTLPLFLEGPMRWLQTKQPLEEKRRMAHAVKESPLFDQKLKMYRLNANLEQTTYEIGRIRAFPCGWLENESIWLHMEYKYLLSLLQAGLYEEFFEDFANAAIPFLPPDMYKRSTLEGSSFLLSSANPDAASHGRGYVARLSGSTAEMVSLWNTMFFGPAPFSAGETGLQLRFCPAVPKRLIAGREYISGTFLGHTCVIYHLGDLRELLPKQYHIVKYRLDNAVTICASALPPMWSERIRAGRVKQIDVYFKQEDDNGTEAVYHNV